MRKIFGLTIVAVLVMAMVGGGTWAYFSDTETSTSNSMVAGTLDIGLSNTTNTSSTGSVSGTFSASAWAPGGTNSGTLYINNDGTMAVTSTNVTFTYSAVVNGTPAGVTLGAGDTELLDKMIIATTVTWNSVTDATLEGKTLEELAALGSYDLGGIPAGTEYPLDITWTFSSTATNGCQGDSVDVTITVVGNQ